MTDVDARARMGRLVRFIAWMPSWLRWDDGADHELTWGLVVIFGFAGAFSVANLYYTNPILNILADEFGVSNERAALIPSVTQAGYAGGLLFVIPLGDILRRRYLVLGLVSSTAFAWLGCTLTTSFSSFLGLSFLVGLLTVTPQLMFPLTVQYAPPRHKATMTSVVMSGVVLGILIARLISGIITQYTSWRTVYWLSFGLQALIFILLFFFLKDYPVARPGTSYPAILWRIVKLPFLSPVLTQMSLVAFLSMGMFTSFWTTLTFQLAEVFKLSTLAIGLFALGGISPVFLNPVVSRLLTSRIHTHGTLIIGLLVTLSTVLVGTFVGTFSLAGPIIWTFLGDLGVNTIIVANRMAIANVDLTAHNAVNSVYMIFTFGGQLFGTAVGNTLYAKGGWTWSGALNIAQLGTALLLLFVKGPHEKGWVGWSGGWDLRSPEIGGSDDHGSTTSLSRVEEKGEAGTG
ncbi:major facilitator superfamily domain-containing protein [Xylaria bambusicola]|uniref:major facilitator superfamily domain-containing protein n=1 Tax=Xylaria bambusicola TaxID=326684 RepID=UPI0020077DA9|nr:major facilitator superfamily domain-containing protein [Xylaria bambusicola]KAI0505895.1 major facilitator superfamily domain-containing protein [Xylaria bambusicola]